MSAQLKIDLIETLTKLHEKYIQPLNLSDFIEEAYDYFDPDEIDFEKENLSDLKNEYLDIYEKWMKDCSIEELEDRIKGQKEYLTEKGIKY